MRLNNVPVFWKGAAIEPPSPWKPEIDDVDLASLFDNAVGSNFNALHVWGGGVYQSDQFYRQADESLGHNYMGHNYMGHNYRARRLTFPVPL